MADTVTSMDVEDVLSSIRRLVSEEAKGGSAHIDVQPAAPQEPPTEAAPADSVEGLLEVADAFSESEIARKPEFGVPPSNDISQNEQVEETRLSDIARSAETMDEPSEPSDQKLVLTDALRVQDGESSPKIPKPAIAPSLSSREDRRSTTRPKPFQFSADESLFERASKAMDALKKSEGEAVAVSDLARPVEPEEDVTPDVTLSAIVEDIGQGEPTPEVDPTPEPTQAAEPADQPQDQAAEGFDFVEDESSVIDEDTLRDMISEMVREELQGELGDRITRNVRKLVRREIQRATTSRELE